MGTTGVLSVGCRLVGCFGKFRWKFYIGLRRTGTVEMDLWRGVGSTEGSERVVRGRDWRVEVGNGGCQISQISLGRWSLGKCQSV